MFSIVFDNNKKINTYIYKKGMKKYYLKLISTLTYSGLINH